MGGGLARASWAGKAGAASRSLAAGQRAQPDLRPRVLSPQTRWTSRAEDRWGLVAGVRRMNEGMNEGARARVPACVSLLRRPRVRGLDAAWLYTRGVL